MADFTGFYLDGIHSSTYGILRVSDGDRYKEGLIPEFEDREIELSGGSGSIYVNTQYKKTPFEINIAFEHLTEQQFRDMRKWLGGEKLHSFRFDERPYKTYWVKLESRPELEYVCFMEESDSVFKQEERIYKGEGTLSFVAYDPFGYCIDNSIQMTKDGLVTIEDGINWQVLDSYSPFIVLDNNVDEWGVTSGLKNSTQLKEYNHFTSTTDEETTDYIAKLYNPGDFEADFELFVKMEEAPLDNSVLTFGLSSDKTYYIITKCNTSVEGKIVLPNTYKNLPVTVIGEEAFLSCKKITEVVIPEGYLSIGKNAFCYCDGLKKVTVPNTVTTLGIGAFQSCQYLEEISIGTGIVEIGSSAFNVCASLKSFICLAETPPKLSGQYIFNYIDYNGNVCTFYVPDKSVDTYKNTGPAANSWSSWSEVADNIRSITDFTSKEEEEDYINDLNLTIQLSSDFANFQSFIFSLKGLKTTDKIVLNSKNHSLTVYHSNGTKDLRYDLVKSTHWPKISVGESNIKITCGLSNLVPQIKYNYKYY